MDSVCSQQQRETIPILLIRSATQCLLWPLRARMPFQSFGMPIGFDHAHALEPSRAYNKRSQMPDELAPALKRMRSDPFEAPMAGLQSTAVAEMPVDDIASQCSFLSMPQTGFLTMPQMRAVEMPVVPRHCPPCFAHRFCRAICVVEPHTVGAHQYQRMQQRGMPDGDAMDM